MTKSIVEVAEDLTLAIAVFKNDNSNQSQHELTRILYMAGILAGNILPTQREVKV